MFEALYYLCRPLQYFSPSLITDYDLCPDMLISTSYNTFYIIQLGLGFEIVLLAGSCYLLSNLSSKHSHVKFVNLSTVMGSFAQSYDLFIQTRSNLAINQGRIIFIQQLLN